MIEHSKAVMLKATDLASRFGSNVNMDLVKAGAMLHDVGRSKTNGVKHAIVGANILRFNGVPPEIVKIVERHIGAGITKEEAELIGLPAIDYLPITLEEKLVAHADNLIHGTREVELDFVIEKWQKKLGKNHPSIPRIIKLHNELSQNETNHTINDFTIH